MSFCRSNDVTLIAHGRKNLASNDTDLVEVYVLIHLLFVSLARQGNGVKQMLVFPLIRIATIAEIHAPVLSTIDRILIDRARYRQLVA